MTNHYAWLKLFYMNSLSCVELQLRATFLWFLSTWNLSQLSLPTLTLIFRYWIEFKYSLTHLFYLSWHNISLFFPPYLQTRQTLAAARMLTPSGPVGQTHWGDSGANSPSPATHSADAQLKVRRYCFYSSFIVLKIIFDAVLGCYVLLSISFVVCIHIQSHFLLLLDNDSLVFISTCSKNLLLYSRKLVTSKHALLVYMNYTELLNSTPRYMMNCRVYI